MHPENPHRAKPAQPDNRPEDERRRTFFRWLAGGLVGAAGMGLYKYRFDDQERRNKEPLSKYMGKESWDPDAIESLIPKISKDLKIKPDVLGIALLELLRKPVGDTVSVIAEVGTKYILQLDNKGTIHCSMFKTHHSKERI